MFKFIINICKYNKRRNLVSLRGQKFIQNVILGRKVALRGQKFIKKVNMSRKVALRGQKSNKNVSCESKAACKFSKKHAPEGFKSCFDTAKSQSSTRGFHRCDIRQHSFDLRRATAILLQRQNFGPNVIYYLLTTDRQNDKS